MIEAPTRDLELAREAASVAAFRMVYAFCAFGFIDFLGAILRTIALLVIPPPHVEGLGITFGTAWGVALVAIVIVASAVKLAMVVSLHGRRQVPADPLALWVALGVLGILGRLGCSAVAFGQITWISRSFGTPVVAAWSAASSAASGVDLLLDAGIGVALLALAARAIQRDRRRPDAAGTYRSAGLS